MPSFIEMPKLSDTMTEGTLAKWLIKEGDTVKTTQSVADVETDKATMEMQTFSEGTVAKLLVQPGQKVPLGAPLAVVLAEGETLPGNLDELIAAAQAKAAGAAAGGDKSTAGASPAKTASAVRSPGARLPAAPQHQRRNVAAGNARVKASPLARKIAAEKGVDLTTLSGTGPGGRIVREDVEHAPTGGTAGSSRVSSLPTIRPAAGPEDERLPVTGMRNIIAERLLASKTQIPHFYLQIEVDTAPLMKLRSHLNQDAEKNGGNKFTVNDFILKAVIRSAIAAPAVNAAWDGDTIVKYKSVGLSVAIAVEDGLVTPVIKNAEQKTLLQISNAVKDLAGKAKSKKLSPDDFAGGTITVSNLGSYGIDTFSAIINPPQAAILSIGSIRKVPVVDDKGAIVAGQRMWIGLSGDHRVVDGAVAAVFLSELRRFIESPTLMLM
jgi:pyruvate dehydrogenase E2 component (dihydrolipoamide acetyltransferase)